MQQIRMTKVHVLIHLAYRLSILSVCIAIVQAPLTANAQEPSAPFQRLDKNADGRLTGEELRTIAPQLLKQLDRDHDGVVTAEEDVQHQVRSLRATKRNIDYAGNDNPRQMLDIWSAKPVSPNETLPILVWIHGGAWRSGSKAQLHDVIKRLVLTKRFLAVSINYRLSQESLWPAQLHDCKAAIRWIQTNAKKFGGDPERIIIMGSSAGGHLVSMITTSVGEANLEGSVGDVRETNAKVLGGINLYGPSNFLRMNDFASNIDHDSPDSPESQLIGVPIQSRPDLVKLANPINYVDANDPPLLLIHGTNDKLVCFNQSELLHDAINVAGGQSTLVTVQRGGHGGFITPRITSVITSFVDFLIGKQEDIPKDIALPSLPQN